MDEPTENQELSEREIEVVRLLAAGLSNKEIAGQLFLSVNTVKVHLRNIFAKLGAQSRTEAMRVAIQRGWVTVPQPDAQPVASPTDIPLIVVEPPLPMWRRATLVAAAIVSAASIAIGGVRSTDGATQPRCVFTDECRPAEAPSSVSSGTRWQVAAPMPTARTRLAVAAYAGRAVAIGGDTPGGATGAVEWFDPVEDTWTKGAAKPTAASNVSAAVIGDVIVVPGGMTASGAPTEIVEIYDTGADAWSRVAPLPAPRMAHAIAAFEGKVYVLGGWNGSAYSATVFVYDPASDSWSSAATMRAPRGFAAAAVLDDAIYIVGGFDGQIESSACERYLPRVDRWEVCPSMSVGRGGLALVTVGPSLYAMGGGWTGYLAFNETFTPGSDVWLTIPTPFTGQWRGLGAAVIDAEIFAIGGWNGQYLAMTQRYSPFPFRVFAPTTRNEP